MQAQIESLLESNKVSSPYSEVASEYRKESDILKETGQSSEPINDRALDTALR